MNNVPEALLQDCLDFMEQGESIEQILARYPELEAEIRPFLETAVQLVNLAPQPSLAAKQKSQKAFLAHAEGLKVAPIQPTSWYRLRQILLPLVSLGAVLFLFITTAVSVSASAIPGDALYSVKRVVENFRLVQTSDPETAVALQEQYRQERIREVQALLRTGRSAEVVFEGEVEGIQTDSWTVATIKVTLNAETNVVGTPQVGETARVSGQTADGLLIATSIEMLTGSAPTPEAVETPTPTGTPTPTAPSSPTATASEEPTAEATDEPTREPTSTATPTTQPTATITPSPRPTATPTLMPTAPANDNDDEGNDNENEAGDNENDNDEGNDNNDNDDDDDNDNNDNDDDNDDDGNDNDDNSNDNDDDDD